MISPSIPMSWGPGWGGFVWTEDIRGSFFEADLFTSNAYTTDQILGGLVARKCQEIDTKVVDDVRNFLFSDDGDTDCLDLVALNIQRGRDHGIPLYNDLREAAGLIKYTSIDQITDDTSVTSVLKDLYSDDINIVDAWVGALAEKHVDGTSLGELALHIMIEQFENLAYGDPNFYLLDDDIWTENIRSHIVNIEELTLSMLIDFNTIISRDSSMSAFLEGVTHS